jgi:hypothetical protein
LGRARGAIKAVPFFFGEDVDLTKDVAEDAENGLGA